MKKLAPFALAILLAGVARPCVAQYVQQDGFSFAALNQSMWGGGGAASASYQTFLGVTWDKSLSVNAVGGGEHTVLVPGFCINYLFGMKCFDPVYADTRTGFAITAATQGTIGIDVGATLNTGAVDVVMPGTATISTATLNAPSAGALVTLNTGYAVDPTATMHTAFPSVEVYADFVFDITANVSVTDCLVGLGCSTTSGTIFDFSGTQELASFNRDGNGALQVLGIEIPLEGSLSLGDSIGPIDFTVNVPNLETNASAVAPDLTSSGDVNVFELGVDVPKMVADYLLPGSGYALSGDWGGFSYTVLGSSLGPRFGIGQEFTFTSTPMTTLAFSAPVSPVVGGVTLAPTTSFDVPLGTNVDFLFPNALTLEVTPTYWLRNSLNVDTDLLSRLGLGLEVLTLGTPIGSLGPLYSYDWQTEPLASIGIDDRTFGLDFNSYQGESFAFSTTPSTVPEPATLLLLGSGLVGLAGLARRRWRG